MRKIFSIAAVAALSFLCSCTAELKYATDGVDITFKIDEESLRATKVQATATPAKDEVFYYWGVIECSELDDSDVTEQHFMDLLIDEIYVQYLEWRHEKLVQGEEYISDFQYHALYYGQSSYYFTELKPETDYYLCGFCVNPDRKSPMGKLYKKKFTTKAEPSPEYRSKMTFDFEVHGTQVMVVPSVEGVSDYYIWSMVSLGELEEYGKNIEAWAMHEVQAYMDAGILRYMMSKSIVTEDMRFYLEPGNTYVLAAGAYDANYEKTVYTKTFVYTGEPDFVVERGHDPMTWYHPVQGE